MILRMNKIRLLALSAAFLISACQSCSSQAHVLRSTNPASGSDLPEESLFLHEVVTDQGVSREYYLYVPENVREDRPLVYCLHGYGGNAANTLHVLRETAEKEGFILCVPQASVDPNNKNGWIVGYPFQEGAKVDDVEFLRNLTGRLIDGYGVSKDKVFVTGMSNGGEMCYILAYRGTDFVRAVAPISGLEMEWAYRTLSPVKAIPLMEAHGTVDTVSRWGGDPDDKDGWGEYIGVPQAVGFWAGTAHCTHEVTESIPSMNDHEIILHRYVDGDDGVEVWLYEVVGGSHGWFRPEMNIGDHIWRFFSMYL